MEGLSGGLCVCVCVCVCMYDTMHGVEVRVRVRYKAAAGCCDWNQTLLRVCKRRNVDKHDGTTMVLLCVWEE